MAQASMRIMHLEKVVRKERENRKVTWEERQIERSIYI
jgi:hypothetical protein